MKRCIPDYQGRGYGQLILDELEARARALGYQTLHLDTSILQLPAQTLYEKNGFFTFSTCSPLTANFGCTSIRSVAKHCRNDFVMILGRRYGSLEKSTNENDLYE